MSTTAGSNPFASATPWETSVDEMLPVGNHVVTIVSAEGSTVQSSRNPNLELKFENDQGSIRAWEAYHDGFLDKIVALYDSAGVERPQVGEFDPEDRCRLNDRCIARLRDKKIGIVVREEPDNRDPTKSRRRVKGYVEPSRITGDADTRGLPQPGAAASANTDDSDDIPFRWIEPSLDFDAWHAHSNR